MNIFKANKTGLAIFAALMLQLSGLSGYADDGGGQNPAQKATTEVSAGGGSGTMTPDLFTGTMSYSIPIDVPPGRNGIAPDINLLYRSGNGNGWLGVGWELEMGSIVRSLKNGVDYNGDDYQFRMAGASLDLVYTGDDGLGNREYRAKIEGAFMRFKKIVDPVLGFPYWEVTDKKGTRYFFGGNASARQYSSSNSDNIFKWCLESVVDTNGNRMSFTYYKNETDSPGQIYLEQIDYAGSGALSPTNYVKFYRDTRTDAPEMYTTNFKVKMTYRLKSVEVYANGSRMRKYELVYGENSKTKQSTLLEIKPYDKDGTTQLPSTNMGYSSENTGFNSSSTWLTIGNGVSTRYIYADFNGDGKTDVLHIGSEGNQYVALSKGDHFESATPSNWLQIGSGDPTRYMYADFNGDGKADVLHIGSEGNQYVALSTGSNFSASSIWLTIGNGVSSRYIYADFNGDGKADVLHIGGEGNQYVALAQGNSFVPTNGTWLNSNWLQIGNGDPTRYKYADFNGDGKTDVLHIGGEGKQYVALAQDNSFVPTNGTWLNSNWLQIGNGGPTRYKYADFNGDGKTDVLHIGAEGNQYVALSTGTQFKPTGSTWQTSNWLQIGNGDPACYRYADLNGDGKSDVLHIGGEGNQYVALSTGDQFKPTGATWQTSNWLQIGNGDPARYAYGDFNGAGKADVLHIDSEGNQYVSPAAGMPANAIVQFSNGLGGTTTVTYAPSTDTSVVSQNTLLPFPIQVVSSVTLNDGNGNSSTTNYSYSDGYFHISEKDLRGFNHVTVTGPAADGKQTVMETWFHQGNSITTVTDPLHPENYIEDPTGSAGYMKGKPYLTSVKDGQLNLYSATTTSYVYDNTPPYFNPPSEVIATLYNGSTTVGKQTKTVYDYDPNYGNVRYEYQYGDVSVSNDELTIYRTYGENQTEWIVGLPVNETVYEGIGTSGAKKSETKYYYDQVADCDAASTNQTPTKGNLTRIERWLDGGTNPESRMAYNSSGNLTCRRDSNGNSASINYDSTYTFPTSMTNALGHVAETRYYGIDGETGNGLYGQVKSVIDPNGAVTSYEYDTFGRRTRVTQPDGSYSTISYNDFGTTSQNIQTSTSAGLSSWTYFDGLGRTIREESTGPDSKIIISKKEYDARGALKKAYLPYFSGDAEKYTTYTYDPVGRVTEITNPDITRVKSCYNDWVTVTIDANSHKKRAIKDAYGRLKQVEEYTGTSSSCDGGTLYATTYYTYDILGSLLTVTDAKNNTTIMSYDTLGRKTSMHDPDMGNWNYYYDQNGNMTSQLDSMNQWIYFQYDALNRLRQKDYSNQKDLGTGDILYNYDELNYTQYAKGRLTSMRDQSGTTIMHYDLMGRVIRELKTVTGTTYTNQYGYDQLGRPNAVTYPDNTAVNYNYNGPLLSSVYDVSTTYAAYSGYNSLGQPGNITYGNGVTTGYTYYADNYRLNTINTTKSGATYQNMTYGYDNIGNITSITDYTDNNQTHEADKIARLNSLNTAPYTYNSPNGVRPHAVTSAGGSTYHYDNNGNMTIGAGRTITYDPENRPMAINASGTSTIFYYDGNGDRVKKATGPTTTVYIGSLYECTNGSCTKYIFANGQRIAAKTAANTFYYHPDHLGGSSMITDANGSQVEYIAYYPFGQTRIDSGTENVPYKYTGQELDSETGLYNYNARLYDPVLGRFISADTIIPDPSDPQAYNRYSYVRNNPVNYIDPSGYWRISISAHYFVGGHISYDSDNGHLNGGVGVGMGAGASIGDDNWDIGASNEYYLDYGYDNKLESDYVTAKYGTGVQTPWGMSGYGASGTYYTKYDEYQVSAGAGIGYAGVNAGYSSFGSGSWSLGGSYAGMGATYDFGSKSWHYSANPVVANKYYREKVGYAATPASGKNNLPNGKYEPNQYGQPPEGSNVVFLNDGENGFLSQGGPLSRFFNLIPVANATAGLHDTWMNNIPFNLVTNLGTIIPAAIITSGALVGEMLP